MTSVSSSTSAALSAEAQAADYPLRFATPETFATVRDLFERAQFTEPVIANRFGRNSLFDFARLSGGRKTVAGPVEHANDVLIRLLLDGETVDLARAEALCGTEGITALRELGVLVADSADASKLIATVMLTPLEGVWVAQDIPPRLRAEDGPVPMNRDVVFPAVTNLTGLFLATLEFDERARVLELCAGTGVAALMAVHRGASEAWSTDVAERSVVFERWNAALNGFENMRAIRSDAWDALAGETFDRIYAHPPYVPALSHTYDYRDGGEDGEHVSRRIIQGLPTHLRPGGRATITCALTDRVGAPIEQRIRQWLGDASDEFDLVLIQRREWDAMYAFRTATHQAEGTEGMQEWLDHFQKLGIERFALCAFELRREAKGRKPITVRRHGGTQVDPASIDYAYRWSVYMDGGRSPEARLNGQHPRIVPGTVLSTTWRAGADGSWGAAGATVATEYPVAAVVDVPPGAPKILELCDGTRDVEELHFAMRESGEIDDTVSVANVAQLIEMLQSIGALEVPSCPVPSRG